MGKMPFFLLGEVATWEIVIWENVHLGSCFLGKLHIWEVATWEIVTWEVFGKVPTFYSSMRIDNFLLI